MSNPDRRELIIMENDIFSAAENDDIEALKVHIKFGSNLNVQDGNRLDMTPIHVACIHSSNRFLEYACENLKFNPWIRDRNLRTAFDHAAACGNDEAKSMLKVAMFGGVEYKYTL